MAKNKNKLIVGRKIAIIFAIIFLVLLIFFLDYKLILGKNWISETYDTSSWRTNEGDLKTNGAWDFEAHAWKAGYIVKYFPSYNWNPFWYLGMPLVKYYQNAFYILAGILIFIGLNAGRAVILLVIAGHAAAVILTFFLCYKATKKTLVSSLCSFFLIASPFITIRSYGWEPISIVFIFLYPLALFIFLKNPLNSFRFWMIIVLAISYLCHPLIFFSTVMTMGLYLLSIALRNSKISPDIKHQKYFLKYFAAVIVAVLIGAVQFLPQLAYSQVTSGAHMGVSYLPMYQVPFNIIPIQNFLFEAGNLKGPGLIIIITMFFSLFFFLKDYKKTKRIFNEPVLTGFIFVLFMMILFYYFEYFNIFPMNFFSSVQYHRIIPEFIIAASVVVASFSNILKTRWEKNIYYTVLIAFALGSFITVFNIQSQWQTIDDLSKKPEFINYSFQGRISFPYQDQSLSVRNSFNEVPQVYGYYEQGITNPYADEIFSVSSGYQNVENSILYLKAANVERLYVNNQEGNLDKLVKQKFKDLSYFNENLRYGYFVIPLADPSFAQSIDANETIKLKDLEPGCREIFKEIYCGSKREEFVDNDFEEVKYLKKYVSIIENSYFSNASFKMINPQYFQVAVKNASENTAIVVKMTYDRDFVAILDNKEIQIDTIGPYFMVIYPKKNGDYTIFLKYRFPRIIIYGGIISMLVLALLILYFLLKIRVRFSKFKNGEM